MFIRSNEFIWQFEKIYQHYFVNWWSCQTPRPGGLTLTAERLASLGRMGEQVRVPHETLQYENALMYGGL